MDIINHAQVNIPFLKIALTNITLKLMLKFVYNDTVREV